ncbi:MAG: hypothetical protein U0441_15730 [Polyangiaceae bacterium]
MNTEEVVSDNWLQTPPEVKIAITDGRGIPQIKIVSTGDTVGGRALYASNMEYYHTKHAGWSFGDLANITVAELDEGDADIDAWVDRTAYDMSFRFARPNPQWNRGTRTSTRTSYLYSAVDPDDASKKIGILIEETAGGLIAVAFYKQDQARADGQLWGTHSGIPIPWTLTRVQDGTGRPTVDPAWLDGRGSWSGCWTLMGAL